MLGAAASLPNQAIDLHAIAPELLLAGAAFVVLFVDLFLKPERKWISMVIAFVGAAAAFAASLSLAGETRVTFGGMFVVDHFAVLFQVFFSAVCMVALLLSYRYFRDARLHQGEYYFLLLCSFLGMPHDARFARPDHALHLAGTGLRAGVPHDGPAEA